MNTTDTGSHDDPFMTLAEVAEELRVNPATVRLWVSKGQLQASRAGMRKLIVRRSEVERMLASVNPAAQGKGPGQPSPQPSVSSGDEPDVPVGEEELQGLVPPARTDESVKELVDHASGTLSAAIRVSSLAPPSTGYVERLRAIAGGFEHVASTVFHAGRTTNTGWAGGAGWRPDRLPYELRPGGNRPIREGLWDRFDMAFAALVTAGEGADILAVGQAFRDVGDELLVVADQLVEDPGEQAEWTVG